jgi:hypothetical protein
MSVHDLVTGCLVYLAIGAALWVVLEGLGVVRASLTARPVRSSFAMGVVIVMVIVGWPVFVALWLIGMMRRPAR